MRPRGRFPISVSTTDRAVLARTVRPDRATSGKIFMNPQEPKQPEPTVSGNDARDCRPQLSNERVIDSSELLQGQRQILILHDGCVYRLLCTRNNKLILQK
jgi:hemin uptake protein HemP